MPATTPSALTPKPCPGVRLYHSSASVWIGVDPLAEKYPGMSPYAYCAGNPVVLKDPDGREIGHVDEGIQKKIDALTNKNSADYSRAFTRQYKRLERSSQVYNFYEATDEQITTKVTGKVMRENNGDISVITSSVATTRTSQIGGFSQEYSTLFEETYHAADYDRGRLDLDNPTCMAEARAWKFAANAPGTKSSCGFSCKTFAGVIKESTITQIAYMLHDGDLGGADFEGTWSICRGNDGKGLYNHLPLK